MIEYLELTDVGPAEHMRLDFAPRLNILTGDNGLGKTFVLDVVWWALTGTWASYEQAWPRALGVGEPRVQWGLGVDDKSWPGQCFWFHHRAQSWLARPDPERRPDNDLWRLNAPHMANLEAPFAPGLVLYVRADHAFAVWDDARNWPSPKFPDRPESYRFTRNQLWYGLSDEQSGPSPQRTLCNGLMRDWVTWQNRKGEEFAALKAVLRFLSPSPDEPLVPGEPTRLRADDALDIPTLVMPYGSLPITLAPAGVERILHVAYLLVWAWIEHKRIAPQEPGPARNMTFLVDELDLHLHPQWQRRILPALLEAAKVLRPDMEVQVITTTHSPLVLASAEGLFDPKIDALIDFDLVDGQVEVKRLDWRPHGDACRWLTSEVFGLPTPGNLPREQAIEAAMAVTRDPSAPLERVAAAHNQLREHLTDLDPIWPRWLIYAREKGLDV